MHTDACEQLLTFSEAAKLLRVSLRQLRRLVDGGSIAVVRVTERTPRIPPGEIRTFIAAMTEKRPTVEVP
jgi:excisionase family DNA binding protein